MSPEEKQKNMDDSKNYYLNLAEDKKNEIKEKIKAKHHNMSVEELEKHKEYQKNYQKMYRLKKKTKIRK